MRKIPYYNLSNSFHSEKLGRCLDTILSSGKYLNGDIISQLEKEIAGRAKRAFGIAVGSCSDAIYFSLLASGVTDKHTVLISSFSHPAALWAVKRIGATPYFLDVNDQFEMIIPTSLNPLEYKKEIGAMVLTHLFGFAQDSTPIFQLAREYGFSIIEDAAQSFGSYYPGGVGVGSIGRYSCLSFDPTKPLGSISTGGMILTNMGESISDIREMAKIRRSGISNLEAEFLKIKLDDTLKKDRLDLFFFYNDSLENIPEIHVPLGAPETNIVANINPSKYVIRLKSKQQRDYLKEFLRGRGIETRVHYDQALCEPWLLDHCEYALEYNSRRLAGKCLSLPFHGQLDDEVGEYIVKAIKDYFS